MNKTNLLTRFRQKKALVGVLLGGWSSEREISLKSGRAVSAALRAAGHPVKEVDITAPDMLSRQKAGQEFEIAFIALHGKFGEDGGIQSVLESLGIVYTCSGPEASRRAMDKFATKEAFIKYHIPTAPYTINPKSEIRNPKLGYPLVVKPRAEGSSVGVSIVKSPAELPAALAEAGKYGPDILVEQFIAGRELTVGILGSEALPVIELKPKQEFYNYRAKYQDTQTEYIVNPDLPHAVTRQIQALALAAHRALGCAGMSRVDFIWSEKLGPFVLEVNSIPGLTERSLLPKAARAAGIEFPQLVERIIELALIP